ncbi:MAG: DUF4384 domain-containing protein [Gemmatimonadales bacterium]
MITALLLTSLAVAPTEATVVVQQEAPVKVWLSKRGDLKRGDRVRVYARAETDGYLLVLHAEPDGRIRVLLPLDPFDDNFVRGGQDLELLGRGDREAFRVYQSQGIGTVYAAFSRDPFRADAFIRDDHWDYRLFDSWRLTEDLDPEAELTALAREMAGGSQFTYDLTHYWVGERYVSGGGGYYSGYYSSGVSVGLSFGFGWYPYWGVSLGWGCCGWGYPWYGWGYYPWYGYGWGYYPWYGWRYPRYAWGYPGYGWGYYPAYPVYPVYRDPVYYAYGGYYNSPGYYTTRYGQHVRGGYTFKDDDRAFGSGGIYARRRYASTSSRSAFASSAVAQLNNRRVSPTAATRTATTGRRVSPTAAAAVSSAGRRASPTARGVMTNTDRRVSPTTVDAARRAATTRNTATEAGGRRVQPDGWGITDGRRTITPTRQPTTPGTTIERRQVTDPVQVDRGTTTRRATDDAATQRTTVRRSTSTPKAGAIERRSTPSSATSRTTVRRSDPVSANRSTTTAPRSSGTVQRSTPSTSRPSGTVRRSTPSTSRPSGTVRRSTPSTSRPSGTVRRSTPTRPSTPTMRAPTRMPSRPSTPTMRTPSRPSTPTMRAPTRAPTRAPARAPTRSGGRRND